MFHVMVPPAGSIEENILALISFRKQQKSKWNESSGQSNLNIAFLLCWNIRKVIASIS